MTNPRELPKYVQNALDAQDRNNELSAWMWRRLQNTAFFIAGILLGIAIMEIVK